MANKESLACFNWLRFVIFHILAVRRCHWHCQWRLQRPCQNRSQWRRSCNLSSSYNYIRPNRVHMGWSKVIFNVWPYFCPMECHRWLSLVFSFSEARERIRYTTHTNIRIFSCSQEHTSVCSFDHFDDQYWPHKSGWIFAALCVEFYVLYTNL